MNDVNNFDMICGKIHKIVKENTKSSKIDVNSSTFYSKLIAQMHN